MYKRSKLGRETIDGGPAGKLHLRSVPPRFRDSARAELLLLSSRMGQSRQLEQWLPEAYNAFRRVLQDGNSSAIDKQITQLVPIWVLESAFELNLVRNPPPSFVPFRYEGQWDLDTGKRLEKGPIMPDPIVSFGKYKISTSFKNWMMEKLRPSIEAWQGAELKRMSAEPDGRKSGNKNRRQTKAAAGGRNRPDFLERLDLPSWTDFQTEFLQYATEHAGLQAIWAWKYTRDRLLLLGPPEGYWSLDGGLPGSQHLFREIARRAVGRLSNSSGPEPWRSWLDQLRAEGYARKIPARKVSPREFRAAVQASGQPPLPPNFESEQIENVFKSSAEYCKVRALSEQRDPSASKGESRQASKSTKPGPHDVREALSRIYDARATNEPLLASRIPQPDHQPAATPVGNKKSEASPNSIDSPEDNSGTVLAATAAPSASSSSTIDIPIPAVPLERESEQGPDAQQTEPDQPRRALKRATEPTAEQRAIAEKLVSEQSEVSIKIAACWLPCSIQHMRRLAKNGDVIASRTKPMRIQTESLRTYKWGKTATKTTNPRPLDPSERAQ